MECESDFKTSSNYLERKKKGETHLKPSISVMYHVKVYTDACWWPS